MFSIDHEKDQDRFNQLETLINDLHRLAMKSQAGHAAAILISKNYWDSTPMEKQIDKIKNTVMNEENFEYLKEQLKFHGFGDALNEQLQKNLASGAEQFHIAHEVKYNDQLMTTDLAFKRSGDRVYFNNYQARIPEIDRGQTFYINNGKGVTVKEAFNLLEGRAVYKELTNKEEQKYKAWIQLDMSGDDRNKYKIKQFTEGYGFDISRSLEDLKLADTALRSLPVIRQSLEKGNFIPVDFAQADKVQSIYMHADPQFKTIQLYNEDGLQLSKEQKAMLLKPENELKVESNIKLKAKFPDAPKEEHTQENKKGQKLKVK